MATGFNIQNMVSSLNTSGVASSSHFEVWITNTDKNSRGMSYRADTANLPGRTIMTTEHKFSNYGPINKVPYGQVYGDSTISFILSEDLREKEFFEKWQNQMVGTGAYDYKHHKMDGSSNYNVKYFDDYASTVTIRQFGADGGLRTIHILQEAYPILMGDVSMAWGSSDPAKLTVTFAYRNYRYITHDNSNQSGLGMGFSFNLGKDGLAGALRLPGIGNISSMSGIGTLANLDFNNLLSMGSGSNVQYDDGVVSHGYKEDPDSNNRISGKPNYVKESDTYNPTPSDNTDYYKTDNTDYYKTMMSMEDDSRARASQWKKEHPNLTQQVHGTVNNANLK